MTINGGNAKMVNYSVTIKSASKELTARERIMMKDTGNAIKFDDVATDDSHFVFKPVAYVVLSVHNEKASDGKDYEQYVILSEDGYKYVTGSRSFWDAFMSIWSEMDGESFELEVYKKDSKNYKGKKFLSCSIV